MKKARELAVKVLKYEDVDQYIEFNLNFVSLALLYYAIEPFEVEPMMHLLEECEQMRIKRN